MLVMQRQIHDATPTAASAEGLYITLADGRRILDGDGGAAVACIGHGDPRVIEAMTRQASQIDYVWSGSFSSGAAEQLAEHLLADAPGGLTHAMFVNSGSEAVEAALKLARQYFVEIGQPERGHFIARRQSFHGVTCGALAISGHVARKAKFAPLLAPSFSHVSPCFGFHYQMPGETDRAFVDRLRDELEAEFQRVGPHRVAAFCAETVVGGTSGAVEPVPGYFEAVREVCDRHGALLILDEVLCGLGRTGWRHAWQAEGVAPDIQTIGKSLGGGYQPISAALVGRKVIGGLAAGSGRFLHGHTFQAHPVGCAAALAVQNIIREENLIENARDMGVLLREAFVRALAGCPGIGDIRGRGLLLGVEFCVDPERRTPFDPSLRVCERIKEAAFEEGLAVFAGAGTIDGIVGDHIFVAPAFNVDADSVARMAELFARAASRTLGPLVMTQKAPMRTAEAI
jgi:adenosylmethionine-8-amino-7-oxononanoate aminotransferase